MLTSRPPSLVKTAVLYCKAPIATCIQPSLRAQKNRYLQETAPVFRWRRLVSVLLVCNFPFCDVFLFAGVYQLSSLTFVRLFASFSLCVLSRSFIYLVFVFSLVFASVFPAPRPSPGTLSFFRFPNPCPGGEALWLRKP